MDRVNRLGSGWIGGRRGRRARVLGVGEEVIEVEAIAGGEAFGGPEAVQPVRAGPIGRGGAEHFRMMMMMMTMELEKEKKWRKDTTVTVRQKT